MHPPRGKWLPYNLYFLLGAVIGVSVPWRFTNNVDGSVCLFVINGTFQPSGCSTGRDRWQWFTMYEFLFVAMLLSFRWGQGEQFEDDEQLVAAGTLYIHSKQTAELKLFCVHRGKTGGHATHEVSNGKGFECYEINHAVNDVFFKNPSFL